MAEYWALDPAVDAVQVFRSEGGRYVRAAEGTDALTTPLLPGLSIPLAGLFA